MKNIAENNLVRFINITKKKDGLFANFRVKGVRGGVLFSATIAVDTATCTLDPSSDPLEKIVEECGKIAIKEFKKTELHYEGINAF
ncbi:MAG TPA: hypothetical protein VN457_06210 [Chlamydiales bacterium]|nr:hypothetical protein [Chlamydiales bacterium]